jgi:hypothetical protein
VAAGVHAPSEAAGAALGVAQLGAASSRPARTVPAAEGSSPSTGSLPTRPRTASSVNALSATPQQRDAPEPVDRLTVGALGVLTAAQQARERAWIPSASRCHWRG